MQEVILLRGLPASGKTTWANEQVLKSPGKYKRINKDNLRAMLDVNVWSGSNEKFAIKVRDSILMLALTSDRNVIIDDTNIHPKHETRVKQLCDEYSKATGNDVNFFIKEFSVPINELFKRDASRDNPVGKVTIKRMLSQWRKHIGEYEGGEYIQYTTPEYKWLDTWNKDKNKTLPPAFIFDVDGTLALMNGRNPFDCTKALEDLNNYPVTELLEIIRSTDCYKIIILTGRNATYAQVTKDWFRKVGLIYEEMYTRAENDDRKDSIIKKELYEQHIKGKYDVMGIFDDRPQVRRMWIEEGLFVFSCYQDPNFMEF